MSDNVIFVNFPTRLDIDPQRVLEGALAEKLESVVIAGYTADGREFFASSISEIPQIAWLLSRFKRQLHNITEVEE